jgi:hypothetical protein
VFDTITIKRSDPVLIDEIRFGSSYNNIIGIFDPPEGTVITVK